MPQGARRRYTNFEGQRIDLRTVDAQTLSRVQSTVNTANTRALTHCMAKNSHATYNSAFNAWVHCATCYSFNPYCLHPDGRPYSIPECITWIRAFIGLECGLRQLNPDSIKRVYLSGISSTLDQLGIFNNFRKARRHAQIKYVLSDYTREWSVHHPASDKVKIPFTLNLAIQADVLLHAGTIQPSGTTTGESSLRSLMECLRIVTALWFGIFFLLRKSEFLPSCAGFRRRHLRFQDHDHRDIPYHLIGITPAHFVSVTIEFSKMDQTGHGRIIHHSRQQSLKDRCIVRKLETYIRLSRDQFQAQHDDLLFTVPTLPPLTSDIITQTMKLVCNVVGLPERKVSAHSLRYGGASMMAAAGFPDYVIAYYGGWAPGSTVMQRYIHPSDEMITTVSKHMATTSSSKTVESIVHSLMAHQVNLDRGSRSRH